ncbi:beta strand repeat-containing protein [Rubritalea marina]|uniref:beta strand repeat-containing protein n=1 Tax=Rubritalea marina TaxID=361055 RepID=UPI000378AEF0|nr:PEP-CTERM sorting domain-containing protein [Rubritalea marina]
MKNYSSIKSSAQFLTILLGLSVVPAHAASYYWDTNGATAGFGAATGTWADPTAGPTEGWSTDTTGGSAINSVTTTSSDDVFFGTDTVGLTTGTVTLSGGQTVANLRFGKASGDITLSGDQLTIVGGFQTIAASSGGGTALGSHTINNDILIASGAVNFGTQNTANEQITANGVISGGGSVYSRAVNNSGVITFTGLNTYTGSFQVITGQANVNSVANIGVASAIGAGSMVQLGGGGGQVPNFNYTGATAGSTDRAFNINSSGAATIIAQSGALEISGAVSSLLTNGHLQLSGTADTGVNTISGVISDGTGDLRLTVGDKAPTNGSTEDSYWKLSGDNTYTGRTILSAGTLEADHVNALGVGGDIEFEGGTLKFTSNSAAADYSSRIVNSSGDLNIDTNGQNVTFATAIANSNTGDLVKEGSGTLTIQIDSAHGGSTIVNGGTLQIKNIADLSQPSQSNFEINNGSTLELESSIGGNNRTVFNAKTVTFGSAGGGTLDFKGGNNLLQGTGHNIVTTGGAKNTVSSTSGGFMNMQSTGVVNFNVADGTDDVDLELSATFANGSINKTGAGKMAVTGTHTQDGNITIGAGTLEVAGNAALNGGSYAGNIANSGTYSHNSTTNQTISGIISGTGDLVKDGTGDLTLTGTNTYTGSTTVNGGLLDIDGDNSLVTGLTTVNTGGALGGVGTIGGDVLVNVGGQLDLTDLSIAAALTIDGNLNLEDVDTGALKFELGTPGAGDMITGIDALLIDGLQLDSFAFTDLGGVAEGLYTLFDATTVTGSLGTGVNGTLFGYDANLSIDGAQNVVLQLTTAVPEPSSAVMLALGAGGLLMRRRRNA